MSLVIVRQYNATPRDAGDSCKLWVGGDALCPARRAKVRRRRRLPDGRDGGGMDGRSCG